MDAEQKCFSFSMHSSDFRMIYRNLARQYILSSDYFSAQGPSGLNPVHDANCEFDFVTCATFKVIPHAHTPSRARAAYTHFGAFICVHALPSLISAPSFSCARCHSGAFIRVRAQAKTHSGAFIRARALPQHPPAPSFACARRLDPLRSLYSRALAASTPSGALIRVRAQARPTPEPLFACTRCLNTLLRLDSRARAGSTHSGAFIHVHALPQHPPAP